MNTTVDIYLCDLPYGILNYFTREDLRKFAHELNIEIGKNKNDTIRNLLNYAVSVRLKLEINE